MATHHSEEPDSGQFDERDASSDKATLENADIEMQWLMKEAKRIEHWDLFYSAATKWNEQMRKSEEESKDLVEQSVFDQLTTGLQFLIAHSKYLYDEDSEVVIRATGSLAYHPQGFKIAVDSLFQLVEKHCRDGSILRAKPTRGWVDQEVRERQELEACEFALLRILSVQWMRGCRRAELGTRDPTLLLNGFFVKHCAFLDCLGRWEYIRRLAVLSRKRRVVVMVTTKAVGAHLPPELLEMVQDELCDGTRVRKLLCMVYKEIESVPKSGLEGYWLDETFSKLSL